MCFILKIVEIRIKNKCQFKNKKKTDRKQVIIIRDYYLLNCIN